MDAGCYCLHALRTLAAAAGVGGLPQVEWAQAELASPASQVRTMRRGGSSVCGERRPSEAG